MFVRFVFLTQFCALPVLADGPVVVAATANLATGEVAVTLSHPDTGWDHYADGWRIEDATETVFGTRDLAHPHVDEQPFTRSLSAKDLPLDGRKLFIRSRCIVDGWSADVTEVTITN